MSYRWLVCTIGASALIASSFWSSSAAAVSFVPPPGQGAPRQATGGASRGSFFVPQPGQGAPGQGTGGASRGNLFRPAPNTGAPQTATGGASRGTFFKPAPGRRAPTQSAGGASRVGSFESTRSITAPSTPAEMIAVLPQSYYGTTLSERPMLYVYLPASPAKQAVFSLKDEAGNLVYQTTLSVSGRAGVKAIALPPDAPVLALGKNYQWFLALKLDGKLTPSTPYVDGWIRRIEPSAALTIALRQGTEIDRAKALGQAGIWYDCLATLARLRQTQPNSNTLNQHWSKLLASVGLQAIEQAPVLTSIR